MKKIIHHIHRVRNQPEHVRRRILHITTVVFAIILFLLWVVSLGRNFTKEEIRTQAREEATPLSALKANILAGYKSIME